MLIQNYRIFYCPKPIKRRRVVLGIASQCKNIAFLMDEIQWVLFLAYSNRFGNKGFEEEEE
jgi:hypothetical protein